MRQVKKTLISTTIAATALIAFPLAAMAYEGTPGDFMQISQLLAKYSQDINTGDGDAEAMNFTPDGVWEDPGMCLIGRAEIADRLGGHHPGGIPGKDLKDYHQAELGPIVYQDKNHATVHSYVEIFRQGGGGTPGGVGITGTYDDKLVRVSGKWKFAYRFVQRANKNPPVDCPPRQAAGFKWGQWPELN
jgi:hypothetical protein